MAWTEAASRPMVEAYNHEVSHQAATPQMTLMTSSTNRARPFDLPKENRSEVNRCCLASIVTCKSRVRARIISDACDPALAPALEVGIDKRGAVILSCMMQQGDRIYGLIYTLILTCSLLIAAISDWDIATLFAAGVFAWLIAGPVSGVGRKR